MRERIEDRVPDTVLFLEHEPVVTLGVSAREANVLASPDILRQRGVERVRASRGGDVTWHGPGQVVMYPILKLEGTEATVHGYVERLEETAIRAAEDFGVRAFRRPGKTGAWTDAGKLAAIGVRVRRWVTCHGMSFNVDPDLSVFDLIVPCGLRGERVTSLRALLGPRACPSLARVRDSLCRHFGAVMGREMGEAVLPAELLEEDVEHKG